MRAYVEIDGDIVPEGSEKDAEGRWRLLGVQIHPFPTSLRWSEQGWVPERAEVAPDSQIASDGAAS